MRIQISRSWSALAHAWKPELEEFHCAKLANGAGWEFELYVKPQVKTYVKDNLCEWTTSKYSDRVGITFLALFSVP